MNFLLSVYATGDGIFSVINVGATADLGIRTIDRNRIGSAFGINTLNVELLQKLDRILLPVVLLICTRVNNI